MSDLPVVVIGSGPGGVVCAAALKQMGIDVVIIERGRFPRFTIGESLLPITMSHLKEVGLLEAVESAGFQKKEGAVFANDTCSTRIDFSKSWNPSAPHAYSLQRAHFDHLLAQQAERRGIEIQWNSTIESAEYNGIQWTLRVRGPAGPYTVLASFVVDSSGSDILQQRPTASSTDNPVFSAVFCHMKDPNRPAGFEEGATWILSNDSTTWGWMIPFSDGTCSVGFVGPDAEVRGIAETDTERFYTHLHAYSASSQRFSNCEEVRIKPTSVTNFRREFVKPSGPGYCLVGNSLGFLDPIFSSGLAIATESGLRAAKVIHHTRENPDFSWSQNYDKPLSRGLRVMSDCVSAWYDGVLRDLIYSNTTNRYSAHFEKRITGLLAGGVWDETNSLTEDTAWNLRFLQQRIQKKEVSQRPEE
ncbi:NAD(P)/FAD-dependent oxidoreductase [Microvenator marinus]|uniref:NAD(P)/FAD-dependent oxidoreductase n=1 Tax=Microvenator marinus TaxID=2600177 RepID=A0A5B8XY84_9DELT|nr:NAD(P)/FAD-dependent oxidoreductase [Microvenator marinus]QED28389.1 NAD(P)/FAD-dependent oxidoreductase [Microvenator marinus]